jgi:hypothetical protein
MTDNTTDFDKKAEQLIPANVYMISGCADVQTSADVSNVKNFKLPDPKGKAGGACTAALLQVLYEVHSSQVDVSWVDLLRSLRNNLKKKSYDQIPQLSSSRMIDVREPCDFINRGENSEYGTKRAVLIGINYTGQQGQLSGCHNDVRNMKDYLINVQGFEEHNMTILMDDNRHAPPTYRNIMSAYRSVARNSFPGDTIFCHYSGHGGSVPDTSGDEDDGYDETLIPLDFKRNGQILDDDLLNELVKPLSKGVQMTCLFDCCHSGTVLDLPYVFSADSDPNLGMKRDEKMNMDAALATTLACCCIFECFMCLIDIFD